MRLVLRPSNCMTHRACALYAVTMVHGRRILSIVRSDCGRRAQNLNIHLDQGNLVAHHFKWHRMKVPARSMRKY